MQNKLYILNNLVVRLVVPVDYNKLYRLVSAKIKNKEILMPLGESNYQ